VSLTPPLRGPSCRRVDRVLASRGCCACLRARCQSLIGDPLLLLHVSDALGKFFNPRIGDGWSTFVPHVPLLRARLAQAIVGLKPFEQRTAFTLPVLTII
jgi:hypothetical protein